MIVEIQLLCDVCGCTFVVGPPNASLPIGERAVHISNALGTILALVTRMGEDRDRIHLCGSLCGERLTQALREGLLYSLEPHFWAAIRSAAPPSDPAASTLLSFVQDPPIAPLGEESLTNDREEEKHEEDRHEEDHGKAERKRETDLPF